MKRVTLVVLAIGLLVLVAIPFLSQGEGEMPPHDSTPSAPPPPEVVEPTPAPVAPVVSSASREAVAESAVADVEDVPAGHVRIEGTITVTDENGVEHPRESGTIELTASKDDYMDMRPVAVSDGRFTLTCRKGSEVATGTAFLGGRETELAEATFPEGTTIELHGTWAPLPDGFVIVNGTVTVRDRSGTEHAEENGTLKTFLRDSTDNQQLCDIAVREGRFSLAAAEGSDLHFHDAVLRGEHAEVRDRTVKAAPEVTIHAAWAAPTILHVVDAASGVDLVDVMIVADRGVIGIGDAHPSDYHEDDIRIAAGRSPIELNLVTEDTPFVRWQEELWVTAPGYTWQKVSIDHGNPLDRRVELEGAGSIQVQITGRLPSAARSSSVPTYLAASGSPRVRLRSVPEPVDIDARVREAMAIIATMSDEQFKGQPRPTEAQLREAFEKQGPGSSGGPLRVDVAATAPAPVEVTGLPPGNYLVTVEVGSSWEKPLVLGQTSATVEAGSTAVVVVAVETPEAPHEVPLAGTLYLPVEWEVDYLRLSFSPIGLPGATPQHDRSIGLSDMVTDPTNPGYYRWDAGTVVPGRYEVTCYSVPFQSVVETGPSGSTTVELIVGAPLTGSLRLLDADTGEIIPHAPLHWHPERPPDVMGGSLQNTTWNAASGEYGFRVPGGRIEFSMHGEFQLVGSTVFDIQQPDTRLELRARRSGGIKLVLRKGQVAVPWDDETQHEIELSKLDGTRVFCGMSFGSDSVSLFVFELGSYRVSIPDQSGFEPVPPFQIDVLERSIVEHEVQLQPRR